MQHFMRLVDNKYVFCCVSSIIVVMLTAKRGNLAHYFSGAKNKHFLNTYLNSINFFSFIFFSFYSFKENFLFNKYLRIMA